MITFACKKISLEEIVRCSFNLSRTEYKTFRFLLEKEKEFDVNSLSKRMGLERTTVQKASKGLLKKGIAKRRQVNIKKGGYFFLYTVNSKAEIREKLLRIIKQWHNNVEKEILKI